MDQQTEVKIVENRELREPIYNERGIIAENYSDLQGLAVLKSARETYILPKASDESTLRAVFQAVEIGLLNLSDITARALAELEHEALPSATVKMFWARGFHRLLARLSMIPHQLGIANVRPENTCVLRIQESPAFQEYLANLVSFDQKIIELIETGVLDAEAAISDGSLDSATYNLIHLIKICNHESTIWENNLLEVHVPIAISSFETFVATSIIREAVYDRVLKGDTYFMQFRGLHQIPEIIGEEVNDRLEAAIRNLRGDRLQQAAEELGCIDTLTEIISAAVPPMADNLATSDYHAIRENLGLTSGSHSVCLRFHMFSHLYDDLCDEVSKCAIRVRPNMVSSVEEAFRDIASTRLEDSRAWLLHLIGGYCLKFRAFTSQWRDEHLQMPRNNLGGESTKSLVGSSDALRAVKNMRDSARSKDPLTAVVRAKGLASWKATRGSLEQYFESRQSLDSRLLSITGEVTQRRFVQVQERLGFFGNRCPFSPPPRRRA